MTDKPKADDANTSSQPPSQQPTISGGSYLSKIVEALIFASSTPITAKTIVKLISDEISTTEEDIREAAATIKMNYSSSAIELVEVANGYRIQTREDFAPYVLKLFKEKPPKYSRALLETLALVIYQQPITRGEISEIRGVSVSSHVIHTLEERGWIEVVGQKEVPGRPALFGTTADLLDYLGITSIEQLPPLPEMKDITSLPQESLMPLLKTLQQNEAEVQQDTDDSGEITGDNEPQSNTTATDTTKAEQDITDAIPANELDNYSAAGIEPDAKSHHTDSPSNAVDSDIEQPQQDTDTTALPADTTTETDNAQTDIQTQNPTQKGSDTIH